MLALSRQKILLTSSMCKSSKHTHTYSNTVPGDRENDCTCSEESSDLALIPVSAVSLLLILTLSTVVLTQCLLMVRMRRYRNKTETYVEATNPNTTDVPVEACALTRPCEEATYEYVH